MALAAATTAYPADSPPGLISQGPTLSNCSVDNSGRITIQFKTGKDFLADDAVHVFPSMLAGFDLPSTVTKHLCQDLDGGDQSPFCSSFGGITPLEVRYNVPRANGSNISIWVPTAMAASSASHFHGATCKAACKSPGVPRGCCTNYTRVDGWHTLTTHPGLPKTLNLPVKNSKLGQYIVGVRCEFSPTSFLDCRACDMPPRLES